MTPRRLEFTTLVALPLAKSWDFFSCPENLERLTPPEVSFDIRSPVSGMKMYEGMIIQYRINPFSGFSTNWVTEITQIKHHKYFIDDQRVGPFALWHHQHWFEELEDGHTKMTDILHYQVPLGPLGTLADRLFVNAQIKGIFTAREDAIRQLFPA